jgi:hypothetical protein
VSNTNLTISMITREALRILENNLVFAKGVNREYDDQFAVKGAKIGDTLNIRKPARYVGRTGATLAVEDHTETSVPLVLTTQFGVDVQFTSKELTLEIDDFSKRILDPAMATIANKIDSLGLALYKDVYNSVGTPGTTPATALTYLLAGAKMDYEAAPRDKLRSAVIDPIANATIVDALKGLFQSSDKIADQYESGNMGRGLGFKFSMDQNVNVHTVGPQGGTPLINTTVANTVPGVVTAEGATSITTDGWTAAAASRLVVGDVFTIAGVYAVNPQSRISTGQLRQFTVTAAVSSAADGSALIDVSPALRSSGAFQTIDAMPANNAAITVLGAASVASPQNMTYHRDAFTLACADLVLPGGVDMAARVSDSQLGLSIRMVRAYDINNDRFPCRLDVLFGWKTLYPELACRVVG